MKWILLVLVLNYQETPSQFAAEFNTKQACEDAAIEYRKRVLSLNEGYQNVKIRLLCTPKGESK